MPAFTTISNALVAVGAKPFATTIQALRDNPLAIAEGDPTAPKILDAALDTGAATAAGIAWVGRRTAGLGVGEVGSYALLRSTGTTSATQSAGSTAAGSSFQYSSAGIVSSGSPSGTWRCMGLSQTDATGTIPLNDSRRVTLWLRIS